MKRVLAGMNVRERWLLGVLLAILLVGGYVFGRGQMLSQQRLVAMDQLQSAEKKLERQQRRSDRQALPELDGKVLSDKDLSKLDAELAAIQASLQGSGYQFIDLQEPTQRTSLMAQVTRLAESQRLLVLSKDQRKGDLLTLLGPAAGKELAALQGSKVLRRPLYDLHLQGSYSALFSFVSALDALPGMVLLARLNIVSTERMAVSGNRILDIELTLAL